tara:strand:+ start:68 stop:238 length:171 start_codon:yes stop_codon:yes gene_type:complete
LEDLPTPQFWVSIDPVGQKEPAGQAVQAGKAEEMPIEYPEVSVLFCELYFPAGQGE